MISDVESIIFGERYMKINANSTSETTLRTHLSVEADPTFTNTLRVFIALTRIAKRFEGPESRGTNGKLVALHENFTDVMQLSSVLHD